MVTMTTTCKVCSRGASLYGVADLHKNCGEVNGTFLPLVGMPIWYYQCDHCRLIFTRNMDDWTKEDFEDYIYNKSYVMVDPDYVFERPKRNAIFLNEMLNANDDITLLDYGGGNGTTAKLLCDVGYNATSWDPFSVEPRPNIKADVVSAIEVFEHTNDPHGTFQEAVSFLKPGGMLVFTTLVNNELKPREMHWYISPRNGHLLMHSYESIKYLCDYYGWEVNHINNSLHTARKKPE
jgi:SAM-dependent methyltransferase